MVYVRQKIVILPTFTTQALVHFSGNAFTNAKVIEDKRKSVRDQFVIHGKTLRWFRAKGGSNQTS
jgi:hypothetical protein